MGAPVLLAPTSSRLPFDASPAPPSFVGERPPGRRGEALEALVRCARTGDSDAFRQVTEQLAPELLAFVTHRLSVDADTAEDVVQDAFVLAWCNLGHIRDDRHLRPWLYKVARYRAISWIRRRGPRGRAMTSIEKRREILGDAIPARESRAEEPRPRRRTVAAPVAALRLAISALKPSYRSVVRLHYLLGFDTRETADVLGISRATVKMRLFRARKALKRLMHEQVRHLAAEDAEALRGYLADPATEGGTT